jgi:type IV secretory pathway TrbF-like protein
VGITQIEFRTPKSRAILKDNPLGLFLVDIDIQEVKS